ncbi:Xaa-Pro aminopeptidase [Thalassotalea marina]|uniref:Xaa-Pro aminopeptidase n=1 Tax=Thalassotalea marina TaxID=1673741 RepID=A0A919EMD9_9GAMM|nr:Xaa-Pro aminopeptidase [Thalassotalea marina]GHF95078.1 Xaa-Pro aminopeptidase [Thalassotalea marina]
MTLASLHSSEFIARRQAFAKQMPNNVVAFIFASSQATRSNDTEYLFCQDKSFLYLTGFNEQDAVLAIEKVNNQVKSILFCLPKDPLQEVWHGKRIGKDNAVKQYCVDEAYDIEEIDAVALELICDKSVILYRQGHNEMHDEQVMHWLADVKACARQGIKAPTSFIDCQPIIDEMRLFKSAAEIEVMKQINHISGGAHQRAMKACADGVFEYQIEAEILHEFAMHGARFAAYNSIVAGGNNANILHYNDNSARLNSGDLLLIDAGGELAGYAADITRTFPVNGKFSDAQKTIYQLVLDAQNACIAAVKPGVSLAELNDICIEVFTPKLVELGLLSGDVNQLIEEKACKKYFIHGLGHWLGLDVHDVGDYHIENKRQTRAFEPGMVMTIEPGLYFPADNHEIDAKWRGIGVRIEDNVLVTDQGHENLTQNVPKSVADIEALMASN